MSKQSTQMGYGKLNEEQLRILEDVPGSAVELQVKDKVNRHRTHANRTVNQIIHERFVSFLLSVFAKAQSSRAGRRRSEVSAQATLY